ncbi:hypothetical protein UK23_21695 [Lentzea aerocolonigenes]|uniref:PucR C-terminal helix-turn-helix domain-containing protein n=1 Tax=Lentzea aerocolonigenes TaxID=68170 RepID=A0A0F0GY94_LENAE|nr:helix-turn-helix domain-containing protein [Lentzea aerocolonigenes]KJK46972.1 hypothetical protein UK23_21695 [Lentzea aerocolonigenes]
MTGSTTTAPETVAARLLPLYAAALAGESFWEAKTAAEVRDTGEQWQRSGGSLDLLLETVSTMASRLIETTLSDHVDLHAHSCAMKRFGDACSHVTIELVRGFNQAGVHEDAGDTGQRSRHDLALDVLTGRTAARRGEQFPSAYAVVALKVRGATSATTENAFLRHGGPDTMALLHGDSGCVLLPVQSEEEAVRVCTRVSAALRPHEMWAAVAWAETTDVPEGLQVASDVLAIVTALHLPSRVYRRHDVPAEYAAVRSPAIASRLLRLIEPVMDSAVLRATLEALVTEDGNRTRAAERLIIHRSTIDYRLQRIEQLTGQCPASVLGMRTLTTAFVLHSLREQDHSAEAGLGSALPQGA